MRPPLAVANISVFDSRNARLYVDAENKIGFLLRKVTLLEQCSKRCGEMDETFGEDFKSLRCSSDKLARLLGSQ